MVLQKGFRCQPLVSRLLFNSVPPQLRQMSSKASSTTNMPQTLITDFDFQISESQFKDISERYLCSLADHLDGLASSGSIRNDEFDLEYSGDVLTISTGLKNMKYVINRQTPNRQMWLSSPISGPFRYDFADKSWFYRRTGEKMADLLDREFKELYGVNCEFHSFERNFFSDIEI